jgi:hypothetical protein
MLYLFGLVQPRKLLTSAQTCGGVSTPCKLCSLLMRLTARAARLPWGVDARHYGPILTRVAAQEYTLPPHLQQRAAGAAGAAGGARGP